MNGKYERNRVLALYNVLFGTIIYIYTNLTKVYFS